MCGGYYKRLRPDYFFAQLRSEVDEHLVSNEGITRWFAYSELSDLEMPYSAKFVIEHYLQLGHATDEIYSVGTDIFISEYKQRK